MQINGKTALVCDCAGSMSIDGTALAKACGAGGTMAIQTQLCRGQIDHFRQALAAGTPLLVGCTQEAPLFRETAADAGSASEISYVNIRERAGWSEQADRALPKLVALLTEAAGNIEPTASVAMKSDGVCLVYGSDEVAIGAAHQLSNRLDVTLLLRRPGDLAPPRRNEMPIYQGRIASAKGHLGAFEIVVDDYAPAIPSGRGALRFEPPRKGAISRCDLILDLTGDAPLFPASERRDGYLRVDPRNPAALQRALFDLTDLVGEFDKPRYIAYDATICAHSRNAKQGCNRCLDVCPTSAITPAGDIVSIDPYICAGCGNCASVCPTGAATYALPPREALLQRLRTLLTAYYRAGGKDAVLLLHDERSGDELIAAIGRFGRGLPANVLPFALNEVTQTGFDFLTLALAYGTAQIRLLVPAGKRGELDALAQQVGLCESLLSGLGYGGGRVTVMQEADPDRLEAALYELPAMAPAIRSSFLPMGDKRQITRRALEDLHRAAPTPIDVLPLPPGAPFGMVTVDADGCTLCLACVGSCPTGALLDNPETPELKFQETACIQCGLCKDTCPEKVIKLEPRLNFAASAGLAQLRKAEQPFHCVRCGKPFGTKSTIDRIIGRLAEKHSMFRDAAAVERLKMCDDCRVTAQFDAGNNPFAGPPRPRVRTTDDDLRERDVEEARAKLRRERGDEPIH